jgi:hypothetical protein
MKMELGLYIKMDCIPQKTLISTIQGLNTTASTPVILQLLDPISGNMLHVSPNLPQLVASRKSSITEYTCHRSSIKFHNTFAPQNISSSRTSLATQQPPLRRSIRHLQLDQCPEAFIASQLKWTTSFQATSSLKYREYSSHPIPLRHLLQQKLSHSQLVHQPTGTQCLPRSPLFFPRTSPSSIIIASPFLFKLRRFLVNVYSRPVKKPTVIADLIWAQSSWRYYRLQSILSISILQLV